MEERIAAVRQFQGQRRTERIGLLRERCFRPQAFVILRAPRNRPCFVIRHETVLRTLVDEGERLFVREDITESKSVVESTEDNVHSQTRCVLELHFQFIMLIIDDAFFSPNRFPCIRE